MADRSVRDLAWLAGIIEGEGSFCDRFEGSGTPYTQLCMTDLDVVIDVAKILGAPRVIRAKQDTRTDKPLYRTNVYGRLAIGWMQTLYPLMHTRRQLKIRSLIETWKNKPTTNYSERKTYSRGAMIAWENSNYGG
jgi:hypothetical protein